jgi:hypothetical protein
MSIVQSVNTQNLPSVRLATMDDLEELISMGRELHQENSLMGWDEDAIRQITIDALSGVDGIIGVIGEKTLEGVILLMLRKFWYTSDWHLEEFLAFVPQQFRKSRNAIALIEFAKSTAERLNMPLLIGIISNQQTAAKIRLYERRLGPQAGSYFLWNGRTGHDKE